MILNQGCHEKKRTKRKLLITIRQLKAPVTDQYTKIRWLVQSTFI